MTRVEVTRANGHITSFKLTGHAGYSSLGTDIVCSAISMATQMTALGLRDIAKASFDCDLETPGYMEINLHNPGDPKASVLAETLELSLRALASQYPENLTVYSR